MKMTDYIGKSADIWTLDGRYYKEVTILDVVDDLKGLKVKDNQEFDDAIRDPYLIFQIVELIVIRSPDDDNEERRRAVRKEV